MGAETTALSVKSLFFRTLRAKWTLRAKPKIYAINDHGVGSSIDWQYAYTPDQENPHE